MAHVIRDYIEVKTQPTVVRLSELEASNSEWISENFYLTDGIRDHLRVLRHHISQPKGVGIFLIGHYGSGKSHFLAYLTQQMQTGWLETSPEPVPLSLLDHKAEEPLEQIVEKRLGVKTSGTDRREVWSEIGQRYPKGLVLMLDELSEFLRSKHPPASFNEDIRFLQFMGEWALDHRLWILAAMQEQIEHTGVIEGALYRKIKDRYPVRMPLTTTHLKDLIGHGLLIKKTGYEDALEKWFHTLKDSFANLKLDFGDLLRTYPLHPVVLELLEEIRDQFSQARGAVEFTLTRLLGNKARGTAPFLDRPFGDLLTPDMIIEHFQDLLELQPEFQPVAQRVLPFYQKTMAELFPARQMEALAWKLLRMLILVHLSPRRKSLTTGEATQWLLYKASTIDPSKNELIVGQILEKLAEDGSFIERRNDGFCLNLADDSRQTLERLMEKATKELEGRGESVFELLCPLLEESRFNPFVLKVGQWQKFSIRWCSHDRNLSVFLGGGEVENTENAEKTDEIVLQIGLPWGEPACARSSIQPRAIPLSHEYIELAALMELKSRPISEPLLKRVTQAISSRQALFHKQVQMSFEQATITYADGYPELLRPLESAKNFNEWLSRSGEKILKRKYPQFENFSPAYGPLPAQAYQKIMEFIGEHDLGEDEAPEYVKLVREAYLVRMGLMERKGRHYQTTAGLGKNELVNLVHQMLPHEPRPNSVYERLSQPIYGLVPDQIHLLLLFLYLEGDIDILKGRKSYRESFNELPLPSQYDRLTAGRGLSLEQIKSLERILRGLKMESPSGWNVWAQKQIGSRLIKMAHVQKERFCSFLMSIQEQPDLGSLRNEVEEILRYWESLEKGGEPIEALQRFLYGLGSAGKFLALQEKLESLPDRFESLWRETQRLCHLLAHPAVRECNSSLVQDALKKLGQPPSLAEPEGVSHWIENAKRTHRIFCTHYQEEHRIFWDTVAKHPVWSYQIPQIAMSQHLALSAKVHRWEGLFRKTKKEMCRNLSSLEFQPHCCCGFLNQSSPILAPMNELENIRSEIESELKLFFQQTPVQQKVRQWLESDPPKDQTDWRAVKEYLQGDIPFPDIKEIAFLDQHLAGIKTHQTISIEQVAGFLCGTTWEKETLKRDFSNWLNGYGQRIRFEDNLAEPDRQAEGVFLWAGHQALTTGTPLPAGLSLRERAIIAERLERSWVCTASIGKLEHLGLGDEAVNKILGWLISGSLDKIDLSSVGDSELCRVVRYLLQPPKITTVEQWENNLQLLYTNHRRFLHLDRERWLGALESLANCEFHLRAEPLLEVLSRERDSQWVILDCFGLPLVKTVMGEINKYLHVWQLQGITYTLVDSPTQTSNFYLHLVESSFKKSFEKINVIDELLHTEQFFDGLVPKVQGELTVALKSLSKKLDPALPVLLFSDHGFRVSHDGRSLVHGGGSMLERLVPVVKLYSTRS